MIGAAEWEALVEAFLATPYRVLRLTLPEGVMVFTREAGGVTMQRRLAAEESEAAAAEAAAEDDPRLIRAPMSGTFYRAPRPGAPPFAVPGMRVGPETVIGIIEAMKLMNAIPAGKGGTIEDFLVADATFVTEGTPLIRLALP
jgi:acetyl-CoA carboxylase biotin carboxyl carrier protein